MHDVLIVSSQAGWAAGSGLAGILSGFGLAAREIPSFSDLPSDGSRPAAIVIRWASCGAVPDAGQWQRAGLSDALVFACGRAPAELLPACRRLPDPVKEAALATALAAAGYVLPVLDECQTIETRIGQLVDGDAAAISELIASMLETNQSDLQGFRQARASQCWPAVRIHAHRTKGTAHLAGAASLVALSQRIETLAHLGHGDTVHALAALYEPAVQCLSQVLHACRS